LALGTPVSHVNGRTNLRPKRLVGAVVGVAFALIALLGFSAPVLADRNWTESKSLWKQMDNCTRAAYKQFPDHTAEANTKRETARLKCLRASNLPAEAVPPPERDPVGVTHR
jgi:hypothetical protein